MKREAEAHDLRKDLGPQANHFPPLIQPLFREVTKRCTLISEKVNAYK